MVRLRRKGMSPLIATVLLMAFAVALGGMVMNWGDRIVNDPLQMCEDIEISPATFCGDEDGVHIQVRNTGTIPLASLILSIERTSGILNTDVGNSELGTGQRVQATIPILVKDTDVVILKAKVGEDRNTVICPEPIQTASPLQKC